MLCLKKIYKSYPTWSGKRLVVLDGINISIEPKDILGITGGNGTGKTTLLKIIAGTEQLESGSIELDEIDITSMTRLQRSRYIWLVTQNPLDNLFPHLTIVENMFLADANVSRGLFKRALTKQILNHYKDQLNAFYTNLAKKYNEPVALLSGGEIQLCSLAMSLINPNILLLDEFVSGLSEENKEKALNALLEAKRKSKNNGFMTVIVSHDKIILEKLGAKIIEMENPYLID